MIDFNGGVRRPLENEGFLNADASTPEGRLATHVIEGAFAHLGVLMRAMQAFKEGLAKTGKMPNYMGGKTQYSYCYIREWIKAEDNWIKSDEVYPFSFRWCCEVIAESPDDCAYVLRKAWARYRKEGYYVSPYKTRMIGGFKAGVRRAA